MKFIKPFKLLTESSGNDITMDEIFDILTDITDEGLDVVLYDIRGFSYYPYDLKDQSQVKSFVVSRDSGLKKNFGFSFVVNFNKTISFVEYIDILSKLSPIIGRFESLGWLTRDENSIKDDNGFSIKYKSIKVVLGKPSTNGYDDIMHISEEDIISILNKYGLNMDVGSDYNQKEGSIVIYYEPQGDRQPDPTRLGRILNSIKLDLDANDYDLIDQGRVKFFF